MNSHAAVPKSYSLPKVNRRAKRQWTGAGTLVAVGYVDPGNWATDIAGGSFGGFSLLFVVLLASLLAMFLQLLSARLGIATGKDLARLTREQWPRFIWPSWIMAELAIISTDLAQVLGSAIALHLLFAIPLTLGVIVTIFDVFLLLFLQKKGFNALIRLILSLLLLMGCGFVYELILASPNLGDMVRGLFPSKQLFSDTTLLYLSIAVIGATVMPHNLYLHSHLVSFESRGCKKRAEANAKFNTIVSLSAAMLLNAAIVVLAACIFHNNGHLGVDSIVQAHQLISPILGTNTAGIVLAVLLLASGQSATITGTLAGQVIMEGFIEFRLPLVIRRLITRALALLPVLAVISYFGESSITSLFVSSQVFLSLQLPLAMIGLIRLTSDHKLMGNFVNTPRMRWLGWICTSVIVFANFLLVGALLHP